MARCPSRVINEKFALARVLLRHPMRAPAVIPTGALLLCLGGARSLGMAPAATYRVAGARAGVIGQLFPAVAHQLQPLLRTPFKAKKQAALRWRTAQARSIVERCTREIKALETRAAIAPGDAFAEEARRARLGELRQEAGVTEGRILLLKARQRKLGLPPRNGWVGDTQRLVETWLATEERSARVLLSLLIKSRDPWDLIRQACNPPCTRSPPPLRPRSAPAPHLIRHHVLVRRTRSRCCG